MNKIYIKLILVISFLSSIEALADNRESLLEESLALASAAAQEDFESNSASLKAEAEEKGLPEVREARQFDISATTETIASAGDAPTAEREINSEVKDL